MTDLRHHGGMSTAAPSEPASPAPDWGAGGIRVPRTGVAFGILAGLALMIGGLLALASPVLGVVVAVVLLVGGAMWVATRGRAVIRDAGARQLQPHEAPRFENIATGLAADLGMPPPGLWLVEAGPPNAFVTWSGGAQMGVTRSVLDDLTRTEVEAVVAQALLRIRSGEAKATTHAIALGPLAPRGARVGGPLDVATAAVTRYPPALASAVAKSTPKRGRFAAAWFVADDPAHVPAGERVLAVEDL